MTSRSVCSANISKPTSRSVALAGAKTKSSISPLGDERVQLRSRKGSVFGNRPPKFGAKAVQTPVEREHGISLGYAGTDGRISSTIAIEVTMNLLVQVGVSLPQGHSRSVRSTGRLLPLGLCWQKHSRPFAECLGIVPGNDRQPDDLPCPNMAVGSIGMLQSATHLTSVPLGSYKGASGPSLFSGCPVIGCLNKRRNCALVTAPGQCERRAEMVCWGFSSSQNLHTGHIHAAHDELPSGDLHPVEVDGELGFGRLRFGFWCRTWAGDGDFGRFRRRCRHRLRRQDRAAHPPPGRRSPRPASA